MSGVELCEGESVLVSDRRLVKPAIDRTQLASLIWTGWYQISLECVHAVIKYKCIDEQRNTICSISDFHNVC